MTAPLTVIDIVSEDAARQLTDRIKSHVEQVWDLVEQAYATRVWLALGYTSWDAYCTAEFGACRIRLPREDRQEVIASLRESGMSTRAIAAATGISQPTVRRDLSGDSGESNDSPAGPIRGTDGKCYPTTTADDHTDGSGTPDRQPRKRTPLPDAAWRAVVELRKDADRLTKLADDDRFTRHAPELAHRNLSDLIRVRDALADVIERLTPFTPTSPQE
ncbi:MAG: hypothetical protein HOQ24_08650 [Mycobacteriaceae bacterium]|nr:hypothetical protein [Mycobacteriaceae bacterium]